ncbi:hypothetical protein C1H46_031001 [Malus baccata]|uniref:Ribosomal RNA small subunit methyltransferase NEP1 n=1 Tax=Malus baccata TaxID=106549 RepID=A0A540LAF8_MALBA|nr:hypothetical protein C1H46_031001 [Malus baccata]
MKTHKASNSNKSSNGRRIEKRGMKRKALERCSRLKSSKDFLEVKGIIEQDSNEDSMLQLPGIPLAPSSQNMNPGVTFVLEKASLVPAYVGKKYQILNPEIHGDFLRKKNMDPYKYRPDIVHEALLQIMDTRLCMAGRLQPVYVKTDQGVLIKVEPHARIPESLDKFCAMMSQLLQKLRIKAKGRRDTLLRVVQNPLSQHLPSNSVKLGLSVSSQKEVQLREYVNAVSNNANLVFVVGAMAHGKIDSEYVDDFISEETVKPNVDCLVSVGIRREALASVVAQYPQILRLPLKAKMSSQQYLFSLKLKMDPEGRLHE